MQAARFTADSCLLAQRWVAPALVYAVTLAATFAAGGDPRVDLGFGAAALFSVAAWLTVATLNDEDDDHAAITAAIVGGRGRLRLTKLAVAGAAGGVLAAGGLVFAFVRATGSLSDLAAGTAADLVALSTGLLVGWLCARPFVSRAGTALLLICVATLANLVVPGAPLHLVLSIMGR